MARIKLPSLEEMTAEQSAQFQRFPANLTRMMLHAVALTGPYLSLGASFTSATLSAKHRELVILRVGALSACAYERSHHLPLARQAGWSEAEIAAIEQGVQPVLDACSAALLRFVDECVYRVRVSDPVFAELARFLSAQQIVETTMLIGHYLMTARILETLDVPLDEAPVPRSNLVP